MRLGLFGGTFDPVHYGHLILAENCREKCRLDEVWFLPTAVPPHKRDCSFAPTETRIEMLELAIAGNERFKVSRYEADRGGVNYTVNTLRHFRKEMPEVELFFLMGADMLRDLPNWREASVVCKLATVVTVRRSGPCDSDRGRDSDFGCLAEVLPSGEIEELRRHQVEMPVIELSSTEIRQRVAQRQTIRYLTPAAVERFISARGLYAHE